MALSLSGSLGVSGVGSSYTVNAPLTMSNFQTTISLGGALNLNANYTGFGPLQINTAGSSLNLNAGTLTATSVGVTGGAILTAQNNVKVVAALSLGSGTAANVFQSLAEGNGLTLQGNLTLDPAATINLTFDAAEGPGPIDYAFRWAGNHVAALTPLLGTRITVTARRSR